MSVELGIIEGYYGRPWTWVERAETIAYLAPHGYRFYLYAPKADPYLRRLWQELHPDDTATHLEQHAIVCRALGVRFGIGLSPGKLHLGFDAAAKEILERKLTFLDSIGIDDLAILFDDMRGDTPNLARSQMEIVHWAAERTSATRVFVCPSYYSDDPVLDRVFGARPSGYVEELGAGLDPAIEMFWTGEEVCSREVGAGHMDRVAERMKRKPFLWDNYPVNDGERMSQFLHVRGFTGRPAGLARSISGHGINPALQAVLTRIPAVTLADSYRLGRGYEYGAATRLAAALVLGLEVGRLLYDDVLQLQDIGLDRLGDKAVSLRERYAPLDSAGAREIVAWLDGEYRITDAIIQAQSGDL